MYLSPFPEITDDPEKVYFPNNLSDELKYLNLFYKCLSKMEINEEEIEELAKTNSQKHKQFCLNICMKLKFENQINQKEINDLIYSVKQFPILKEEVMMRLVGCRSVERMTNVSQIEIEDLTSNIIKKAYKLQIASDWKFIVGLNKECLDMKKEAIISWGIADRNNKVAESKQELEELKGIMEGKKVDSFYALKMKILVKIVAELSDIPDPSETELMSNYKKRLALISLPYFLKNLNLIEAENSKIKQSDKNISTSILKKRGLLDERKHTGEKFMKEVSKNNFAYVTFLPESRYEFESIFKINKKLGILNSKYFELLREFFNYLTADKKNKNIMNSKATSSYSSN